MSSSDINSALKRAERLLQKGELLEASLLFQNVLTHMSSESQLAPDPIMIRTMMQLAVVDIYSGHYYSGMGVLNDIKRVLETVEISSGDTPGLIYDCDRWVATRHLYAGRRRDAASQMQTMAEKAPREDQVRLHIDRALAYAYLGQYEKTRSFLELAEEGARNDESAVPGRQIGPRTLLEKESSRTDGSVNDGAHAKNSVFDPKDAREWGLKDNSLTAAKARIDILTGDYPAALKHSSEALDRMKAMAGDNHFLTLAMANLKTWSLAYSGKYNEAETLCCASRILPSLDPNLLAALTGAKQGLSRSSTRCHRVPQGAA